MLDIEKGILELELPYTEEQAHDAIEKHKFVVEGIEYAGWCSKCNSPVLERDAIPLVNISGLGRIYAEIFHRRCTK